MQTNQDLSVQNDAAILDDGQDINGEAQQQAADSSGDEEIEVGTTEPEGGSFEDIEKEGGLANNDQEADGLEREAYINSDLVSEEDIKDARESLVEESRRPDSPLSDPTQTENN